jgi:hypothetical protein
MLSRLQAGLDTDFGPSAEERRPTMLTRDRRDSMTGHCHRSSEARPLLTPGNAYAWPCDPTVTLATVGSIPDAATTALLPQIEGGRNA